MFIFNEQSAALLFVLAGLLVLYVLAGHPLLLALTARRNMSPIVKQIQWRTVSVLLPVRNGERWVRSKLDSLFSLDYPRELIQILVISDGSSDRTDEIVDEYASSGIELIRIPRGGKAAALNAGMARATGEILFFTDVRQQLDSKSLGRLMQCFADPTVGVASGELIIGDSHTLEHTRVGVYWRYEKWIRTRLSQIDSVLGATGCIYAMRRELAVPLPSDVLLDDVYLPLAAFFRGYRVILESSARAYDYPTELGSEFLRKVRTLAGVYQTLRYYPALLTHRNRMWLHFMSHKIGRLLLPHALVVMSVTSFALPDGWREFAVGSQAAFYVFAAADIWMPERWRLKCLTSYARTFLVLMTAAFCAVPTFLFGGLEVWAETRVQQRAAGPAAQAQLE
jgi:biofilm PGA synthesis N-glycosyltransferase PgaC